MAQRVGLWPRRAAARVRLGTAPSPARSGAMSDRSSWMNEELRIFRRSVRRFVETELAPHEPRWRAQHRPDAEAWAAAGRAGMLLARRPGGIWRRRRHPGARDRRLRGACPSRRAFRQRHPVHRRALHPGLRLRGAEAALAPADGFGRARRRDRDERARRRLRSVRHRDDGPPRRRRPTSSTAPRPSSAMAGTPASSASPSRPTPRSRR